MVHILKLFQQKNKCLEKKRNYRANRLKKILRVEKESK